MFRYCIALFGFTFSVSTSCHAAVLNSAASLWTFMSRQQWVFMTAVVITTHRWSQPRDSPHGSADQSCCPELTPASVRSSNSTPEITCMSKFGRSSIFINSQSKTSLAAWLVDRYTTVTFVLFFVSKPKLPNDLMLCFSCQEGRADQEALRRSANTKIFKNTLNVQKRVYCTVW